MKKLSVKAIKPNKMTETQKKDFVLLHQRHISLDDKTLLNHLSPRDFVLLFYDRETGHLVATIGIQMIHLKQDIFLYFGNVVVDAEYKHQRCIAHSSAKCILKLFIFHPFKRKYCCGLASSSGALEYSLKHRPAWPNPDDPTPPHMTNLMRQVIEEIGIDKYRIENGNIISMNLSDKIKGSFHVNNPPIDKAKSFFNAINPGAEKGEQVFFVNPFSLVNALDLAIQGLHGHLIKRPKLYHRIIRNKTTKPFFTMVLLAFAIVRNRF